MTPGDFDYKHLQDRLAEFSQKGWQESAAFVLWFLLNVFRLDETIAQDAVCDGSNDKGIDAIYVDNDQETVFVLQGKITQKTGATIGDTDLKEFAGTLAQFQSPETIVALGSGNARPELVSVLTDSDVANKVGAGYRVTGVFVTNRSADVNAVEFLNIHPQLELYDSNRLAASVIDVDFDRSIEDSHTFSIAYAGALQLQSGKDVTLVIAPISAIELLKLRGISDGTLFQRNVRLSLGSTAVNKDISKTIKDASEHERFVLYHNGITILCDTIKIDHNKDQLVISGYSVVNGAQSLSTIYQNAARITEGLRILVKFIALQDEALADRVTWNSNNQNAIKYRDQRSNDIVQRRLQQEFEGIPDLALEIKRGEKVEGKNVISNEEAGLLILAYDLCQPWVCHQKYKIFDELYSDIFCRPTVKAKYISLIYRLMQLVNERIDEIENERVRRYTLTRYFLLYCLRQALELNPIWKKIRTEPGYVLDDAETWDRFSGGLGEVLIGLLSDLNGEIEEEEEEGSFDYKEILKSPQKSKLLARKIVDVYKKELKRGKLEAIDF